MSSPLLSLRTCRITAQPLATKGFVKRLASTFRNRSLWGAVARTASGRAELGFFGTDFRGRGAASRLVSGIIPNAEVCGMQTRCLEHFDHELPELTSGLEGEA